MKKRLAILGFDEYDNFIAITVMGGTIRFFGEVAPDFNKDDYLLEETLTKTRSPGVLSAEYEIVRKDDIL
jgi:hypothetical protein